MASVLQVLSVEEEHVTIRYSKNLGGAFKKMSELYNVKEMAKDLFDLLRLTVTPIGIKLLEKEEDIAKIERCRCVPEGVTRAGHDKSYKK